MRRTIGFPCACGQLHGYAAEWCPLFAGQCAVGVTAAMQAPLCGTNISCWMAVVSGLPSCLQCLAANPSHAEFCMIGEYLPENDSTGACLPTHPPSRCNCSIRETQQEPKSSNVGVMSSHREVPS